ncbi:unnamed protein product [Psylliodes chrysocephalus]|uniref:CCHC-type domain-containing protein n=1 Tax=Psylliodes chrysocephalus TaxID=3402493 RepID=A0A9P0G6I1_9CUCU|nr:unnamed protein product [Psylliodes chrysocephala]
MITSNENQPLNTDRDASSVPSNNQHQNNNTPAGKVTVAPVPRFLLVKRKDKDNVESFDKVSPFLIAKSIYGLIGDTNSIRKTEDGLIIHTKSDKQSSRMLNVTKLNDIDVIVTPHGTLNISKGVIYCKDLLNCSIEEILSNLEHEGVTDVRRLKRKINDQLEDTPNHILTFNKPNLPKEIKAAYYNLQVRPYIPPPTRCFNCQKFGHVSATCTKDKLCSCGLAPHESQPCEQPIKCINCEGSHSAYSKTCPKYSTEAAILKIKITEKIPYIEAKRKVAVTLPRNISYATATNRPPNNTPAPINTNDVIKELTPNLEQLISKLITQEIQKAITNTSFPYNPFQYPPQPRYSSRPKRNRDSSEEDSMTSETSVSQPQSQTEKPTKKKKKSKGWPKGKPRKVTTLSMDLDNPDPKLYPPGYSFDPPGSKLDPQSSKLDPPGFNFDLPGPNLDPPDLSLNTSGSKNLQELNK